MGRGKKGSTLQGRIAAHLLVALCAVGVLFPQRTAAQPITAAPEYEIKAAFLLNFAKFVDWPAEAFADPQEPLRLGIVGHDPFGDVIDRAARGHAVRGRAVVIVRPTGLSDLDDCHILFISGTEPKNLRDTFQQVAGKPILTVGEFRRFLDWGGMIRFKLVDDRIGFEIARPVAERAGLKLSAKLLSVAAQRERP